jgi:hypothetical protein
MNEAASGVVRVVVRLINDHTVGSGACGVRSAVCAGRVVSCIALLSGIVADDCLTPRSSNDILTGKSYVLRSGPNVRNCNLTSG